MRRLDQDLIEHSVPRDFDVLSIDIEGEDTVLNDLIENSPFGPHWVITEASYNFKTKSLVDLPLKKSVVEQYGTIGQTKPNLLLAKRF